MSIPTLKTIQGVSPGAIDDATLASEVPVYLPNFSEKWPVVMAAKQGSQEAMRYMVSSYSGEPIRSCYLSAEENGRVFYNHDMTGFNYKEQLRSFLDVAEELMDEEFRKQKTVYISSTEVARCFPKLGQECQVNSHKASQGLVNIWIGGRSRVAAHYDAAQNLACCLVGRRKFTLFPPDQIANLYPGPLHFSPGGREISMVDFHAPDLDKFPRFKKALANSIEVELSAGDALIIPGMWWHHVEGLDAVNVLLTHWWKNSSAYLARPASAMMYSLMAIRDLPPAERSAWKALFDHYVFDASDDDVCYIPKHAQGYLSQPLTEMQVRQLRAELQNHLRR